MTGLSWPQAAALCNTKTKQTGEHWTLQQAADGSWGVYYAGPYQTREA